MELWYRRTFNLSPTDPRYLDATLEDMYFERMCHQYDDIRRDMERQGQDFANFVEADEVDPDALDEAMQDDDAWEDLIRVGTDSD